MDNLAGKSTCATWQHLKTAGTAALCIRLCLMLLCRLIEEMRKKECSWREIFWKLWGLAHVLLCSTCLGHFPAVDLPLCRHHPQGPVFAQGKSSGSYLCYLCCADDMIMDEHVGVIHGNNILG